MTLLAAVLTVKGLALYSNTVIKFLQSPWLINQIFIHLCKYTLNREYPQSWASQYKRSFMSHWQNPENMRSCFAFLMHYVLFNTPFPKNRTQMILLMASVRRLQLKLFHYCFIPSFFKNEDSESILLFFVYHQTSNFFPGGWRNPEPCSY